MKTIILLITNALAIVDVTNQAQMKAALAQMSDRLLGYYSTLQTSDGAILNNQRSDSSGFQWYENGIMWGAIMEHTKATGYDKNLQTTVNAITMASYGPVASFLGTNVISAATLEGKWNDDILWWALPALTGAEFYGSSAIMPGGVGYMKIGDLTYKQVMAMWDTSPQRCFPGGLWWSRDRNNAKYKNYKSTITHSQAIMAAARLSILTGDKSYAAQGDMMYNWVKKYIVKSTGPTGTLPGLHVFDGVDVSQSDCNSVNGPETSYNAGFLIGGLAWLYQATKNTTYITDANAMATANIATFTKNGIITDTCEGTGTCEKNRVTPKGATCRGLGYLLEFTNDDAVRKQIHDTLLTTATAIVKTCDAGMNCGNEWASGVMESNNIHSEINSLECLTAYYKTFTTGALSVPKLVAPSKAPIIAVLAPTDNASTQPRSSIVLALSGLLYLFL